MPEVGPLDGSHVPPEMKHLLQGVSQDRERIISNFYRLTAGVPDSEIVQFALFSKVLLEDIRTQQNDLLQVSTQITGLLSQKRQTSGRLLFTIILVAFILVGWVVWQDHISVEQRIVSGVSHGTSDALQRLNANSNFVRYLANIGVEAQLSYGTDGNPILVLHGRPGIAMITEAKFKDGKLYIPLKR